MRQTHEWTDDELDFLEKFYVLRGSAFIRARYPHLTPNGCRQMATRLNLIEDMREYTPLATVAREAGVTPKAVRNWLRRRPWARRHCLSYFGTTLIPLPVIRLYHPESRRVARPRGWLTISQAATRLHLHDRRVRHCCQSGALTCVMTRGEWMVDPHSLPTPTRTTPPAGYVSLAQVARETHLHRRAFNGIPAVPVKGQRGAPGQYADPHHVRQFLSARGHQLDVLETIIRKCRAIDASRTKNVGSDMEER